MAIQIDILKPEARELLRKLEDRKLISIRQDDLSGFESLLAKLRARVKQDPITRKEIVKEVEAVRAQRHASRKGSVGY